MLAVLMVDADAANGGTGQAWGSAYNDLQDAFTQAAAFNTDADGTNDIDAIWIAEGTYTPTARLESGDARSASFSLIDGVTLFGGFAGTEDTLDARDWSTRQTILSGVLGVTEDTSDNAYTVVYSGGGNVGIDGISITGGNANDPTNSSHIHMEKNSGGGVYKIDGTLTIANSTIYGNSASYGGGLYNRGDTLTVTNSILKGNSAVLYGGGIHNVSGTLTVANSLLAGNSARSDGGGAYNRQGNMKVTNSTLSGNSGGGVSNEFGVLTIANSIVSLNSEQDIRGSYSDSTSVISLDPGFVQSPSAGADGVWGTGDDDLGDLRLTDRSRAVNGGSNSMAVDMGGDPLLVDLTGSPRIADGTVDIGAYEYQGPPAVGRETPSLAVSAIDDEFDLYDDEITLREAIYYSQSGIGDGTVTFNANLDGATITLDGQELWLRNPIAIDASTLSSLTVDADSRSRVFRVTDDVTLSGLTITRGSSDYGGGVHNAGNLTITLSTITKNMASAAGGGVHNSGTLAITNSTFFDNSSMSDGGGVSSQGDLTIADSSFLGNSATNNGGGVYNASGTLNVTSSTVLDNSAGNGGGIFSDSALAVTDSLLIGNSATYAGGAIYCSTMTVIDSTIRNNRQQWRGSLQRRWRDVVHKLVFVEQLSHRIRRRSFQPLVRGVLGSQLNIFWQLVEESRWWNFQRQRYVVSHEFHILGQLVKHRWRDLDLIRNDIK
ncbi:MAG: hypothetical protein O3C40_13670 [Planctomycetota bacterium]|nr:hypothetical protein [Planctomycetota bacterium]